MRTIVSRLTLAMALAGATPLAAQGVSEAEARAIHERILTVDTHIDTGANYATYELDPGGFTHDQVSLPGMRAGGMDAGFFIVYTRQGALDDEGIVAGRAMAEDKYQGINRMIRGYPDQIGLATTADEAEAVAASGRLVAFIGMENAYPLGNSLDDVPMWAERGVRYMGLTHFGHNQFAGSSNPREGEGEDAGLTDLGRELVAALNDHGIVVDLSHVGRASSLEATRLSRTPVIASHSGAKGVYDNLRNLDDEQLLAIRDNGGVAQMVAYRPYVAEVDAAINDGIKALQDEMGLDTSAKRRAADRATLNKYEAEIARIRRENNDVTLAQFIDHVDYAVGVVGIDHVGIASDFDGGGGVEGWDDASETFNVTLELLNRGYSEEDIAKLWGGNALRVLRANEDAAVN